MRPRSRSLRIAWPLGAGAALILVAIAVGWTLLDARRSVAVSPIPTGAPSDTPSATPAASLQPGTFENAVLGYRITLPQGYRRSIAYVFTSQQTLGVDVYTRVTEQAQREACQQDAGHVPSVNPEGLDIRVGVVRNVSGVSAMEWATTPQGAGGQVLSTHQKAEPATIGGREAVRLVADNATAVTNAFVIRANDRIYELYPTSGPPPTRTWLDEIAQTFVVIGPAPFPTPTATPSPRETAREVAEALVRALAAKDADAVARLMPDCWIGVAYAIDGTVPGQGGLNRSVFLFTRGLRDRFARGDLTVTVDPTIQLKTDRGGDHFFVRSEWKELDRTTRIDLFIEQRVDRWMWSSAVHHFRSGDVPGGCIPYRSPWVSETGSC